MADLNEIKNLLQEQGNAWDEYKKTNDERLSRVEKGLSTSDHDAKLAALEERMGAIDEIKSKVVDVEKALAHAALADGEQQDAGLAAEVKTFNDQRRAQVRPGYRMDDLDAEGYKAYKSAFIGFMRHGEQSMGKDEIKALQAGVDPDGGFLLPPPVVGRIVSKVYELSPIRSVVSVVRISGNELEGIEDLDEASLGGWVTETGARNESNTPRVSKWRIEAHEMYAQPKITQRLLDDAAADVEGWLANKIANKYARTEADAFHNGNGVGKPRGIFAYPHAQTADAARAWGTVESVKTGANGAFHTTKADPLFDLIAAFKPAYLNNARWLTNRQVIAAIRKLKEGTSDQYLWQPGLQQGQPDRLLGFPILLSQDVPAIATGSLSMAFGDFAEGYTAVERMGIRVLRDPYTEKPYIKFYSTMRVGGGMLNTEAVKFLTFAS